MQTKTIERYFFFGLLLIILFFTFSIFRPFWIVLVLGASLAVVLHPIHKGLLKIKFPNWLSALITVLVFIIVVCVPLFFIGLLVFNQSQIVYHSVVNNGNTGEFLTSLKHLIESRMAPLGITFDINQKVSEFISFLSVNIANIFNATISAFFSFVLLLLSIFYFLKDGDWWRQTLTGLSPLKDADDNKIMNRVSQTINGVIRGYLLIGLIQGVVVGAGLSIFGVPHAALWGVIAAVSSLVPPFGTGLVTVPSIIFLLLTKHYVNAVGLLIWAVAIAGSIDNFLNPILISKKINIPPFLILFAVLGGITVLGPVGILIGPLTVSLLHTLILIYLNEFKEISIL